MAVPAHDQRDYEFATTFDLPIIQVVAPPDGAEMPAGQAFAIDGTAMNSGPFDGLTTAEFKEKITADLQARGVGKGTVRYKLRDWVFSRQRYWGEPIPIVHCDKCGAVPVPDAELPLLLPEVDRYEPTGTGESPLAGVDEWVNTSCPSCGAAAKRETNTMPQWAGSCWYYLRYMDPHNTAAMVDPEKERYWMPVDMYVGGAEHAVLHLMYARFWHQFLYDIGAVSTPEPFGSLRNQGMILGFTYRYLQDTDGKVYPCSEANQSEDRWLLMADGREVMEKLVPIKEVRWDGERALHPDHPELELDEITTKMSKSLGNVVNPDEIIDVYGADVMRLYEMFMGPFEASCPWNTRDIEGVNRFLNRAWRLYAPERRADGEAPAKLLKVRHRTIKAVTDDLETMGFNTALARMMEYVNELTRAEGVVAADLETLALLVCPFAPHFAEEVWHQLGHQDSVFQQIWPTYDEAMLVQQSRILVVQVNGKKRATAQVPADIQKDDALALAKELVPQYLEGKQLFNQIFIPKGMLVNLVVKG